MPESGPGKSLSRADYIGRMVTGQGRASSPVPNTELNHVPGYTVEAGKHLVELVGSRP